MRETTTAGLGMIGGEVSLAAKMAMTSGADEISRWQFNAKARPPRQDGAQAME